MDSFQAQQTLVYLQGRKAYNVGRSLQGNPYVSGSAKSDGWLNGWMDASQGLGTKGFLATTRV